MKKKIAYLGIVLFFIVVLAFGAYKLMNARDYQLFGKITSHIDTTDKVVALSFDDGPTKNVNSILTLLDDYDAKATFFLIGKDIEENLEESKKIVNAGHQIGNHTYSHKRMVFKSPTFYKNEIEKTDELIKNIGYSEIPPVRPPYGKKPDSFYTTPDEKINYVKEYIQPGSIILMHPMYDNTDNELQAIEGILQSLSEDGYRFVTIKELQDKS
ncbi:polysaccharide deacetylase family protein [Lysinibacillus sp. NPDC047702]|uniref:polysaccharide deacetylase family protein n=1 Tax=unclassified Lysinibacillus TaxID=2636778 RepID=UPI003CFD63A2